MKKYLFLILSILFLACSDSNVSKPIDVDYNDGLEAYRKENYEKAFSSWLKSCENGNNNACDGIGFLYKDGWGVDKNIQNSMKYFEKACQNKHYESCKNLANHYYFSLDKTEENILNAFKYYYLSCEKNISDACFSVGIMFANGEGVEENFFEAKKAYEKACKDKNSGACNNLGVLYANGQGVRQDKKAAKEYYGKACDYESQLGCDNYKHLNELGI